MVVSAECVPDFWYTLGSVKDGLGNSKFPLLSYFMTTMTVLPHSSACAERIFSLINRMKTKSTSLLQAETVENRLLAKQAINWKKLKGCSWEPSQKLNKEVENGIVRKRYIKRLQNQSHFSQEGVSNEHYMIK